MYEGIEVVAEVKTRSPFGYSSRESWDELFEIANQVGDIISVHTDFRWGGSFDLIEKARRLTSKPILAKGIHSNDKAVIKALEKGADYVLVVGRIPPMHLERCWIEPCDLEQLKLMPLDSRIVWNSRNLQTGMPKNEAFEQTRELWKGWLCQASYIKEANDIKAGADAILVGTYLREFSESL